MNEICEICGKENGRLEKILVFEKEKIYNACFTCRIDIKFKKG